MTNAWPAECVKIFNTAKAGDFKAALPFYRLMTPAFLPTTIVEQRLKQQDN